MVNANTSQEKLNIETKKELAATYQSLYNSIVDTKLANGMSKGESWHEALLDTEKLIHAVKKYSNNQPIFDYLEQLFKTHKRVQAKKTMLSPEKNEYPDYIGTIYPTSDVFSEETLKTLLTFKKLLKILKIAQIPDEQILAQMLLSVVSRNKQKNSKIHNQHILNCAQRKMQR